MKYTEKYKYLGEIFNSKGNLSDQIKELKGKAEAAYQTMLAIAGNKHFQNIEMKTIWKMLETCIIPILTYAGETRNPTKKENKEINSILALLARPVRAVATPAKGHVIIGAGCRQIDHHASGIGIAAKMAGAGQ